VEARLSSAAGGGWASFCQSQKGAAATAAVVCRQLGFSGPALLRRGVYDAEDKGAPGKPSAGAEVLEVVECSGKEASLAECSLEEKPSERCLATGSFGVACNGEPIGWEAGRHARGGQVIERIANVCRHVGACTLRLAACTEMARTLPALLPALPMLLRLQDPRHSPVCGWRAAPPSSRAGWRCASGRTAAACAAPNLSVVVPMTPPGQRLLLLLPRPSLSPAWQLQPAAQWA